jgi:hypothetical protein
MELNEVEQILCRLLAFNRHCFIAAIAYFFYDFIDTVRQLLTDVALDHDALDDRYAQTSSIALNASAATRDQAMPTAPW